MESIRLSEQKDTLLRRLADTEAENAVSYMMPTKCTSFQPDQVFGTLSLIRPADDRGCLLIRFLIDRLTDS